MSLNCLSCNYTRTDSQRGGLEAAAEEDGESKAKFGTGFIKREVNRSWSGNLVPRPGGGVKPRNGGAASNLGGGAGEKKVPMMMRRHSGPVECETPRLIRSWGMRRDWSFEDLRQQKAEVINA